MLQENTVITPSAFCVYDGYEFEIIEEQRLEVVDKESKKANIWFEKVKYIKNSTDKLKRWFNPLTDTPELATELLKVDPNNDKSVLAFVNEYGLPDHTTPDGFGVNRLFNEFKFSHKIMPVDQYRLSTVKTIAEIWKAIGEKDQEALKHFIERFEELSRKGETFSEEWEKIKNKDSLTITKTFLAMVLNECSIGTTGFRLSGKKIVPTVVFVNLFEVAQWQLANAITNDVHFKTCELCGHLFIPQHGHQRFCPAKIGHKISTCQNTFNQRNKRTRKKVIELAAKGYSVKEISVKLQRSVNDIKEFIEND